MIVEVPLIKGFCFYKLL